MNKHPCNCHETSRRKQSDEDFNLVMVGTILALPWTLLILSLFALISLGGL